MLAELLGIAYEDLDAFWHGQTIESVFNHFGGNFDTRKALDFTRGTEGEVGLSQEMTSASLAEWYSINFDRVVHDGIRIPLMKGAQARFNELRDIGVPTAIVTSADGAVVTAVESCTGIDWPKSLHRITADYLDGKPGKPHQYPVLRACELANVQPREAVFIGDSLVDVLAGWLSGTRIINVNTGSHSREGRLTYDHLCQAAIERGLDEFIPTEEEAPVVLLDENLESIRFCPVDDIF